MDSSNEKLEGSEITRGTDREISQLSLGSVGGVGQMYEGAVDEGVVEGGAVRRQSMDSCSNFSIDSAASHLTSESRRKTRRSSRKARSKTSGSSKSRKKGSSSGPSYSDVELDAANRMLEERDIVVSSLVKQVEELQQQVLAKNKSDETRGDVASEKDLAEELIKAKRLLAEKEVVTESLIEQTKMRQIQLDEKTNVIEEQNKEIARLKAKLASASGNGDQLQSSSRSLSSKIDKSDRKKDSRKKKKRESSIRKLKPEGGELTPSSRSKRSVKLPKDEK